MSAAMARRVAEDVAGGRGLRAAVVATASCWCGCWCWCWCARPALRFGVSWRGFLVDGAGWCGVSACGRGLPAARAARASPGEHLAHGQSRFTPAGHPSPIESAPPRPPAGSNLPLGASATTGSTTKRRQSPTARPADRRLSSFDLAGLPRRADSPRLGTPAPSNRQRSTGASPPVGAGSAGRNPGGAPRTPPPPPPPTRRGSGGLRQRRGLRVSEDCVAGGRRLGPRSSPRLRGGVGGRRGRGLGDGGRRLHVAVARAHRDDAVLLEQVAREAPATDAARVEA